VGDRIGGSPISLSDPTIALTLLTVVLWLGVIVWKLRGRDQAGGARRLDNQPGRGGYRARRDDDWEPEEEDDTPRRIPEQARGQYAEIGVNPGKCMRFAFCEQEAPEIFQLRGDRIDYKAQVGADQLWAAEMAEKVCPARAIKVKLPQRKPYLPQPPVDDDERRPIRR
jgi:ferredoxin